MKEEWLSLGEAAESLGVHPSTVRSWADQGRLPTHRTPGGHRRFRKQDVELQLKKKQDGDGLDASVVVQNILLTARLTIGEGTLEKEAWYQKLDNESRGQYRLSGRSLVQGLVSHLHGDGVDMEAEARSLGYEYASRGRRCGLSSVEAAHAFQFFRTMVMDSVLDAYEAAAPASPQVWTEMVRKMNRFSDLIIITLLETYDAFARSGR
jgi:excisionase family DNA binding protein